MPRNGSGTYSVSVNFSTEAASPPIEILKLDSSLNDIGDALTASIAKDGQTNPSANLPMNGFRHTGVGNASARNQYPAVGQLQDGSFSVCGSVLGTNTITAELSPALTSYSAGMFVILNPANTNTDAATLSLNGLAATDLHKMSGQPLEAGDLVADVPAYLVMNNAVDGWYLINPQASVSHANLSGIVANQHIDHSAVSITAGNGLTGGGDIAASRSLNVGAGTGITVGADSISTNDSAIVHGNLSGYVANQHVDHSSVSITGGTGLSGGGSITTSRSINLDISGLSSVDGNAVASSDGYLVDDGGTMKRMAHSDAGVPPKTVSDTSDTLATEDMNKFIKYTNGSAVTVTLNSGVGKSGNWLLIQQAGAGQVTVSGTATLESAVGTKTRTQHSVIGLLCTSANTWTVYGDTAA